MLPAPPIPWLIFRSREARLSPPSHPSSASRLGGAVGFLATRVSSESPERWRDDSGERDMGIARRGAVPRRQGQDLVWSGMGPVVLLEPLSVRWPMALGEGCQVSRTLH